MPEMKPGPYFYCAKLKSQNVKGRAYLEMWSRFPGRGEFFSKDFDHAIKGTNGWAEYEMPFLLKPGEQPDLVKLNVVIEGGGTVWVKDVELRGRVLSQPADTITPPGVESLELVRTLVGHTSSVGSIDISSDGRKAVSSSHDRTMRLWDVRTGECLHVFGTGTYPGYVDISPDDRYVAHGNPGGILRIWNLETREVSCTLKAGNGGVRGLAFSPDSRFILAVNEDGSVRYWDVENEKVVDSFQLDSEFKQYAGTQISDDGQLGVVRPFSRTRESTIYLFDLRAGELLRKLKVTDFGLGTGHIALSRDARSLLVPDGAHKTTVFDLEKGTERQISTSEAVVSFLPDNRYAVWGGKDGVVSVRDLRTGTLVGRSKNQKYPVGGMSVARDGRVVLTGHSWFSHMPAPNNETLEEDFAIRVWRMPGTVLSKSGTVEKAPRNRETTEEKKQAAMTAARAWLKLVDAGKYGEAWEACAAYARNADDKQTLIKGYTELFEPLGELKSRDWKGSSHTTEMPRAPKGDYVVIQFNTQFNKGRVLETVVLMKEQDEKWRVSGYFHALLKSTPAPAATVATGVNLITDPSLENTAAGSLPRGWSRYVDTDREYKYGVVAGGRAGEKSLMLSGEGTRIHAFVNGVPIDRTKRYVLRGWVRYEGDETGSATIKFNYRKGGTNYFIDDGDRVSIGREGWQFFTKTDRADETPEADMLWVSCKLEGNGKAYFDDLELIAYDRDKLPADFEEKHGKHNKLQSELDFTRWVGRWETTTRYKPTRRSKERTVTGEVVVRTLLDGRYLLWEWTSVDGTDQYTSLLTLDKYVRGYHFWVFGSEGEVYERIGQWDVAAQTLKLQVKPPVSGVSGVSTDRFVNNDRIESTLLVKNGNGEVSLDMQAKWTRKSKTVESDLKLADRPAPKPPQLALLQKLAGDWKVEATLKPSVWERDGKTETFTQNAAWCSGGRFLVFRAYDKEKKVTSLTLQTWEPKEKVFRVWYFDAESFGGRWNITWDASSQRFHWRAVDMPDGWIGTGFNHRIDDDTFENQGLIKDGQGRILLDRRETMTRVKSSKPG